MSLTSLSRVTGSHVSKGANRPRRVSRPGTEWHLEFRSDRRQAVSVAYPEATQYTPEAEVLGKDLNPSAIGSLRDRKT
jgi:hypothetical protein